VVAAIAEIGVIAIGDTAAVPARDALPVAQRHVRAGRVIGFQHTANETKRINEPALPQSILQGNRRVAGTKILILHVGMCDALGIRRWMRIERDHLEAFDVRTYRQPGPLQSDQKAPEFNLLQNDGISLNGDGILLRIEDDIIEFGVEMLKLGQQILERRGGGGLFQRLVAHVAGGFAASAQC
jgi:hypothetical protein